MRDIKETLTYKRLRMYLIIYIVGLFVFLPLIGLLKTGDDMQRFKVVMILSFILCSIMFLPFIVVNTYRMYRFVKAYKNSNEFFRTDTFSFVERYTGRRSRACSILVTVNGVTYNSPCIFYANDVSAMLNQTLVYLFDGNVVYPLWSEPKTERNGDRTNGEEPV